jgi:hypothetical protein
MLPLRTLNAGGLLFSLLGSINDDDQNKKEDCDNKNSSDTHIEKSTKDVGKGVRGGVHLFQMA